MTPRASSALIGAGFEATVVSHLQLAANRKALAFDRLGTRAQAARAPDGTMYFRAGRSMPDFIGCIRGGSLFVFDAKQVADKSWHLAKKMHHQLYTLERYATAGGLAFFLVQQTDELRREVQSFILRVPPLGIPGLLLPRFVFPPPAARPPGEGWTSAVSAMPLDYPLAVHRVSFDYDQPNYFIEVMHAWCHR